MIGRHFLARLEHELEKADVIVMRIKHHLKGILRGRLFLLRCVEGGQSADRNNQILAVVIGFEQGLVHRRKTCIQDAESPVHTLPALDLFTSPSR